MLKENGEFSFEMGAETELDDHSRDIHERAVRSAKKYLVAEAELLACIMAVDRDKTYLKFGETHLTPYCEKYLELAREVAANFVRVARKSLEVPSLKDAVDEGLSVTKAKTIVSVVTEENCGAWVEKAKELSKEKLEKEVVKENPKAEKKEKTKPVGENRTRVEFELNDADMALLERTKDIISQKLQHSASLAEVAHFLLEEFLRREDPVKKAERAKTRKEKQTGQDERSRERSSRKKRSTIPAAVKHAVNARDRGQCQAKHPDGKKCGQSRWVHLHHIKPKAEAGEDTVENLITLCSAHHRMWHRDAGG